jgi:hypothetical protein
MSAAGAECAYFLTVIFPFVCVTCIVAVSMSAFLASSPGQRARRLELGENPVLRALHEDR